MEIRKIVTVLMLLALTASTDLQANKNQGKTKAIVQVPEYIINFSGNMVDKVKEFQKIQAALSWKNHPELLKAIGVTKLVINLPKDLQTDDKKKEKDDLINHVLKFAKKFCLGEGNVFDPTNFNFIKRSADAEIRITSCDAGGSEAEKIFSDDANAKGIEMLKNKKAIHQFTLAETQSKLTGEFDLILAAVEIFEMIEIKRLQKVAKLLFAPKDEESLFDNFEKNDIKKVQYLTGSFYNKRPGKENFLFGCSGVIIPGQDTTNEIQIATAKHCFEKKEPETQFMFKVRKNAEKLNPIESKGFEIKEFRELGSETRLNIADLTKMYLEEQKNSCKIPNKSCPLYSDYIIAVIPKESTQELLSDLNKAVISGSNIIDLNGYTGKKETAVYNIVTAGLFSLNKPKPKLVLSLDLNINSITDESLKQKQDKLDEIIGQIRKEYPTVYYGNIQIKDHQKDIDDLTAKIKQLQTKIPSLLTWFVPSDTTVIKHQQNINKFQNNINHISKDIESDQKNTEKAYKEIKELEKEITRLNQLRRFYATGVDLHQTTEKTHEMYDQEVIEQYIKNLESKKTQENAAIIDKKIEELNKRYHIKRDFPSVGGISGGAVLDCEFQNDAINCNLIGTVQGKIVTHGATTKMSVINKNTIKRKRFLMKK